MDLCPSVAKLTIPNTSLRWGDAFHSPIYTLTGSSYLRPDMGGALLPWIYTAVVIVVHIPTVVIRVQRWETAQTWCLAATLLTVVLYAQAYVSTGFAAEQVLTWTPLLLVIDAGSMLQLFVLVVEAGGLVPRVRGVVGGWGEGLRRFWSKSVRRRGRQRRESAGGRYDADEEKGEVMVTRTAISDPDMSVGGNVPSRASPGISYDVRSTSPLIDPVEAKTVPISTPLEQEHEASKSLRDDRTFWVAVASLTLFIAVFVLQLLGLQAAVRENRGQPPSVSWCSPIFQPFGVAVLDGDCHLYAVEQTFNKGIGCIRIPGVQQMAWIKGTLIVTSIALVLEAVDLLILILVHSKTKWAEVKMRRPWCTIFGGMAVLGVTLLYGIRYSYELPPGITERVVVAMDVHGDVSIYAGTLATAGVRGAIIGWNDGLFSSWGTTYFGAWAGG